MIPRYMARRNNKGLDHVAIGVSDVEPSQRFYGDAAVIPPGHDAWTVGDEACVMVDFAGMEDYAKPA